MRLSKQIVWSVFAISMFFVLSQPATGQGIIVPGPCERCTDQPPGPLPRSLPVRSIKITTTIKSQVATTHIEQVFTNETNAMLQGTYLFPIPEDASIGEFAIWDGDRRLTGEVRSREEARRIYDAIVRRQRDPGLLEYAGKNLFQASIFPILAHSDKKLELSYTQVLKAENGTVGYRYPLGTGHNSVEIGSVSGSVDIEAQQPVRNIYSPSHDIETKKQGANGAAISFGGNNSASDPRDFQLFYSISREDFGMSLLTHREPGKDGYFLLTVSPKDDFDEREYSAKDILFIIDTSGSMSDEGKMEKARAALLFGVRSLHDEDRFNVISFSGEDHLMGRGLIAADSAGRARGESFIKQLRPSGGTNINEALLSAEGQFDSGDKPKIIVFITDGLPTVGERNIEKILSNVRGARSNGVRIFSFGVGYDVNTALLDKLSSDNGGVAEYIEPKEDLEQKVSSFFDKVSFPVLTNIKIDLGNVDAELVYPREMPDLFKGSQLTLIGRYRNAVDVEPVKIRLSGKSGGKERTFLYDGLSFPVMQQNNDFVARLWANRRVGWLMEQIRSNGEQAELRDEVVDLGTRYGIVTPYTSYLAVEQNMQEVADQNAVTDSVARPVKAPKDQVMKNRAAAPQPVTTTSGAGAVAMSKEDRKMQDSRSLGDDKKLSNGVKRAGGKTFYYQGGIWVDSEYKPDSKLPETTLVFASDAYFELLRQHQALGTYFSISERVVVVFEGRVYKINAQK